MQRFNIELTDTFGGEANYSWVLRWSFTVPDKASDLAIIRKAKKLAGMSGVRCRTGFGCAVQRSGNRHQPMVINSVLEDL